MDIQQGPNETLKGYHKRYNDILLTIPEVNNKVAYMAFYHGLSYGKLKKALVLENPLSKDELTARVRQYVELEELKNKESRPRDLRDTLGKRGRSKSPRKTPVWDRLQRDRGQGSKMRNFEPTPQKGLVQCTRGPSAGPTPLRLPIAEVYAQIEDKRLLPKPMRMRSALGKRDKTRYCEYHREHGQNTNECRVLDAEIEKLIKRGYLKEYTAGGIYSGGQRQGKSPPPPQVKPEPSDLPRLTGRIDTISGGSAGGGDSRNSRKGYARRSIYAINQAPSVKGDPVIFTNEELIGIEFPHDDPLVIAPIIANFVVKRMLVDTGSSVDILYIGTFDKLQLQRSIIQPLSTPLTGFTGHSIRAMGIASLDLTMGTGLTSITIRTQFTIVDIQDQSYNGLIGRPTLAAIRAIVSPTHLKMKFPTPGGIGEMSGDQQKARRCYQTSVPPVNGKPKGFQTKRARENHMEINSVEKEDGEANPYKEREGAEGAMPHEEIIIIPFKEGNTERTFRIGSRLGQEHQRKLMTLIREFEDIFAWGPKDMPGVDPTLALHRLYVDPAARPVKQKKRLFSDKKNAAIREEVQALLQAQAIRELQFPEWVANVVLVKKPSGKWRMCTDFTNLNKTCPKDLYPLPCLGRLVDGSVGHEVFDFMDASKGYHQIRMAPEDEERTAFITEYGLYCWQVMPFGLKTLGLHISGWSMKSLHHRLDGIWRYMLMICWSKIG
ncbi:hypothetical protein LIER_18168 [Lithospermum erythrorhizon]|uniref:Reverse transcriptase domain-containing protein n=1 Tax=Lithospermum erythrorhizon TaxID=34254 RepID=A0AAV3QHE9_LITER